MKFWIICLALVLGSLGLSLSGINEYVFFAGFVILQFVVLATAWNILGGYAGYVNFGVPAFVAVGGYTAVVLFKSIQAPILVQILGGGILAGVLGLAVGLLTLKLRGIFFSIATVAVVFILETVVMNWRYVGGATGLQLTRPADLTFFDSYTRMLFFVMAVLAIGSVIIARYIQNSFLGRGLRAVRDSEEAAECSGVPTLRIKLIACVVSGALMGVAGAPMPMYLSYIEPTATFNLSYSISALAMPIIGGTSHWMGPVIGALLLGTLQQIVTVT
ncbi:MAG: branched-chain amino acid ABC transporter permease, partial [Betaproteobacteria bacterium]|nr:branched-chain amino acid ABC transporter permease [Betaproteobacteria bacterium]